MKKKNTLILLFMLVFGVIVLLGFNNAWAADDCSLFYNDAVACSEVPFGDFPGYVIVLDGYESGQWIYNIYPDKDISKFNKPPAINWYLFYLGCTLISDPSNVGISVDEFQGCLDTAYDPWHYVKVHSGLNTNKKVETIKLAGGSTLSYCGKVVFIMGSECVTVMIPVPECTSGPLQYGDSTCKTGDTDVRVIIQPSECGDEEPKVTCNGFNASLEPNAQILTRDENDVELLFPPQNFGIDPGCILCMDDGPPVAILGKDVYLCPR